MSKKKIIQPEIIDKLISEIDDMINKLVSEIEKENISEKDVKTLNTGKLNKLYVKIYYLHTMSSCRQCLTDFRELVKVDEDRDKLESGLRSDLDKLSDTNKLNLLQILLRRDKELRKNVEEFKKKIPESLDNLEKSKLYYERINKEKKLTMENMSPEVREFFKKTQDAIKKTKKK